jgi:protein-S-isoprenylcysteine O-methyltransferase Ste14
MYYSRNGGCLFLIIGAFVFMFFLSAITSLLFTPVGMGIALILGGYYLFKKNRLEKKSEERYGDRKDYLEYKKKTGLILFRFK